MSHLVYVIDGPNLNLLGERVPEIYGHETLADVEGGCRRTAAGLMLDVRFHRSNAEFQIVDWMGAAT